MRTKIIAAAAILASTATVASAQDIPTTFRGFRAEGQVGYDKFQSQGVNNEKLGYGAEIGFDGTIADKFVIGPVANYWRANGHHFTTNNTGGVNGGEVSQRSFGEFSVGVRGGFLVTPDLLVFGRGGYAQDEQRRSFNPAVGTGETPYYSHRRSDGYQVGGGVEYTLPFTLPVPVYVSGQYLYSNYADHTSRQRAMLGVGVRFK